MTSVNGCLSDARIRRPVSSWRVACRPQARSDRLGAAVLGSEQARDRVPGQADGRGGYLRRQGADARGRRGGEFFIVLDGSIRIERGGSEINRLGPGDFLGEIALIDQGPRTATAIADGPARVMVLTSSAFASMLSQNPGVESKILRVLASRVRDLQPTAAL